MSVCEFLIQFAKSTYETLTVNSMVICAMTLSVVTSAIKSIKQKGKLDWVEALLCGCLTLAVSSTLEYLKLPREISIFLGGFIGFKGSLWVDAFINRKTDSEE
ncbi:phage holin family protein [Acinetobacter sp. ANC 4636]